MSDINAAQSNFAVLSFLKESEWGVTPTNADPQSVFYTGESLKVNKDTQVSEQIEPSGNVPESRDTKVSASGGFNFEFGMTKYTPFLEAAFRKAFRGAHYDGTDYDKSGSVDLDFRDANIVESDGTWEDNLTFDGIDSDNSYAPKSIRVNGANVYSALRVGQVIKISGTTENNGTYLITQKGTVTTSSSNTYNIIIVDKDLEFENPATDATISGESLINGIDEISFSLEKHFRDIDTRFGYTGMRVSSSSLSFTPGEIITGSFEFMGQNEIASEADGGTPSKSIFLDGTDNRNPIQAINEELVTGSDSIRGAIQVNSEAQQAAMELTINTNSNLREQPTLGQKEIAGIGDGRLEITGSLKVYLRPGSEVYSKFRDHTPFSLFFQVGIEGGKQLHFYLPRCYFTEGQVFASGISTDTMQEMEWQAHLDENLGSGEDGERFGGSIVISCTE